MKERPILFSAPMVHAILAGTKTQTRRALKPKMPIADIIPAVGDDAGRVWYGAKQVPLKDKGDAYLFRCRYGMRGDRLWVKETWRAPKSWDDTPPNGISHDEPLRYVADEVTGAEAGFGKTRVSIHMPRWASRITLELTNVRVERLHDISQDDAIAEGIERVGGQLSCTPWKNYGLKPGAPHAMNCSAPSASYMTLWSAINGAASVKENPWVWAITFKQIKGGSNR